MTTTPADTPPPEQKPPHVGERGVYIGGSNTGPIITGDHNVINLLPEPATPPDPESHLPLRDIPFSRNPNFSGRVDSLHWLTDRCQPGTSAAVTGLGAPAGPTAWRWGCSLPRNPATFWPSALAWDDAVTALRRYSLVTVDNGTLNVHRLVQATGRDRLEPEELATSWTAAADLVIQTFPEGSQTFW